MPARTPHSLKHPTKQMPNQLRHFIAIKKNTGSEAMKTSQKPYMMMQSALTLCYIGLIFCTAIRNHRASSKAREKNHSETRLCSALAGAVPLYHAPVCTEHSMLGFTLVLRSHYVFLRSIVCSKFNLNEPCKIWSRLRIEGV